MPPSRFANRCLASLAVAFATLLGAAVTASASPFAPDNIWDSPLAQDAALAPNSAGLAAELRRQTRMPGGTWINTTQYSVPVYTVGPNQPTVRIIADTPAPGLQQAWDAVPLPPDARPAAGTDGCMVIYQPSTDTMWEFWVMYEGAGGWHAVWGGKMEHVSSNPGYFDGSWGSSATGMTWLGGLIRPQEMAAGHIDHALALSIPQAKQGQVVWPAQRGDGIASGPDAIPEGTRFRIDPDLDLDTLHLAPAARIIARAIQDYGMIVRDQAGAVTLFGEDPLSIGSDPWPALLGDWPHNIMNSLPWDHMEAVVPDRSAFCAARSAPTPTPVPTPTATPTPPPAAPTPVAPTPTATPVPPAVGPDARDPRPAGAPGQDPGAQARQGQAREGQGLGEGEGEDEGEGGVREEQAPDDGEGQAGLRHRQGGRAQDQALTD